ncbi:hypothetical protein OPV22_024079 [Ensete ventricosum]|uniref:Agenet domain-containing protein n=1 Tax=Ensete ventricosum TaxID=4639 RepID=A0AAV8QX23_ENSVE|nr:hypothetical protein OPV22_024079 [Ensete ventricosum]
MRVGKRRPTATVFVARDRQRRDERGLQGEIFSSGLLVVGIREGKGKVLLPPRPFFDLATDDDDDAWDGAFYLQFNDVQNNPVRRQYGVPIRARDILGDLKLKENVKDQLANISPNIYQRRILRRILDLIEVSVIFPRDVCPEIVDVARVRLERRVAMRFKKGNKVEVWSRRELASGSWWSAEIISGNGHNYSVRYDGYPTDSSVAVDRVPRKAIRPCPPPVEGLKDVKSGDVVEVFDNNSWKLAEVLMVFDKKYCSVRLIGSSREFRTHNSHIRRHLSWQDEQWVVIHKESGKQHGGILNSSSRGEKFGDRKPQSCVEMVNFAEKSRFPIGSHDFPDNTRWVLPRGMKKRTLDLSIPAEMCYDGRRKTRAVEKDGKCHRIITKHPIQCFEKGQNWRLPNFDSIDL